MNTLDAIYDEKCSVASLQTALKHRHLETQAHCERVALLALALADRLGLEAEDQHILLYSAILHDVGKIGIPDAVLLHPGELDHEQTCIMQMHVSIGEEIVNLMKLDQSETIARFIRHHHEHYDGSGYPDGLRRDEIPYLSRLLGILDSYDALTEGRPYREALPHTKAVEILQEERGTKHDPELLDIFLKVVNERPFERI